MSYINFLLPAYFIITLFSLPSILDKPIKFLFLLVVCVAMLQKKNKPRYNKKNAKVATLYVFSILILCVIHSLLFNVPDVIVRILSWLFIFVVVSAIDFKGKTESVSRSISLVVVVLNIVLVLFCIKHGEFAYPRWAISGLGIDKPVFSLFYGVYFCLAYVEYLIRKNKMLHMVLFPITFILNVYVIQSKLALTAFVLFAVVHFVVNKNIEIRSRIKKLMGKIILVFLLVLMVNPSMISVPDEFKTMVNQVAGKEVIAVSKMMKDDNTYTMRAAIRVHCFRLFFQHPLFGVGLGNYKKYTGSDVTFYTGGGNYVSINEAESQVLGILVEGGLWYIVSYALLCIYILKKIIIEFVRKKEDYNLMVAFSIIVPLVYMCFGNDFFCMDFWILLGFTLSVIGHNKEVIKE